MKRWFYIDIEKALDPSVERDEAIISLPEDKRITADFGRETILDLTSVQQEYATRMYPVSRVFDWDDWQDGYHKFWDGSEQEPSRKQEFKRFKKEVLDNFKSYDVPVIALDRATSKEAVCTVFEWRRSLACSRYGHTGLEPIGPNVPPRCIAPAG